MLLSFVFFFQAEDGIRDIGVTGVQTCALPISGNDEWLHIGSRGDAGIRTALALSSGFQHRDLRQGRRKSVPRRGHKSRSEERRVGKGVDLGGRRNVEKKKKKREERVANKQRPE